MTDLSSDPVLHALADLPRAVPDDLHSAAVRARCHTALARRRRRHEAVGGARGGLRRVIELVAFAALGLLYASAVIRQAAAMYGA